MTPSLDATPFLRGWRVASFVIAAAIGVGLRGLMLADSYEAYRRPWLQAGLLLLLLAIVAMEGALLVDGRAWGAARWPVGVGALAVCAAGSAALPAGALLTPAHWSINYFGWVAVILFADRSLTVLTGFIAIHYVLAATVLFAAGRGDQHSVAHLVLMAIGVAGFQIGLGSAARALRRLAAVAGAASIREHESRTAEAVAEALHTGRSARYEALRKSVLPLLRMLDGGRVMPADPRVQRRCAIEAARLRRLFAEADDVADPLVNELTSAVGVAQRKGIVVSQAESGTWPQPPPEVRRVIVDEIAAVTVDAETTARVTVSGDGSGVVVSVVADAELAQRRTRPMEPVRIDATRADGRLWVRAEWRAARTGGPVSV